MPHSLNFNLKKKKKMPKQEQKSRNFSEKEKAIIRDVTNTLDLHGITEFVLIVPLKDSDGTGLSCFGSANSELMQYTGVCVNSLVPTILEFASLLNDDDDDDE